MFGILLCVAVFLTAPAINIYFISQHYLELLYWTPLAFYVWSWAFIIMWYFSHKEIFRGAAYLFMVGQIIIIAYLFGRDMENDNIPLYVVYILSIVTHMLSLYMFEMEKKPTEVEKLLDPRTDSSQQDI